jgi:hypothetical protein
VTALPAIHAAVGILVVICNAAAALLLWPRSTGGPPEPWAARSLMSARAALAAQVLLGVALAANGYAGRPGHYLAALGATAASWWAAGRSRTPRDRALGCALTCALALVASVIGRP